MQPGTKCAYCEKLAVSICNYRFRNFTGCSKAFCREHGIAHYSPLMIENKEDMNNQGMMDENTKKMMHQIKIDRNEISTLVA